MFTKVARRSFQIEVLSTLSLVALFGSIGSLYFIHELVPAGIGTAYIFIHLIMTGAMLCIWWDGRLSFYQLLVIGCLLRIVLFPAPFLTSNDAERYLWDGAVALSGLDPYVTSPNSEVASELRKIWPTPPEHAAYPTLYPPSALALFSISALGGPTFGIWIWKGLTTAASIGSLFAVRGLLNHLNCERHFALMALSPLLILESGVGAHLDSWMVLSVCLALNFMQRRYFVWAGAAIGFGATIKLLPITLIGPLIFYLKPRQSARLLLGVLVALFTIYGVSFASGLQSFGILQEFAEKWRFGSPIFSVSEHVFPNAVYLVTAIGILACYGIAACVAFQGKLISALLITLSAPMIFGPVAFPWYLSLLVPLIVLRFSFVILIWLSTAPLTYIVLNDWLSERVWEPSAWPLFVIFSGWVVGGLLDLTFKSSSWTKAREVIGLRGSP